MREIPPVFKKILAQPDHRIRLQGEIRRLDNESGLDEVRAANLIISQENASWEEILDDGLIKGALTLDIHDPIGSLFPYTLDSPTSFLGNRIVLHLVGSSSLVNGGQEETIKFGEFWIESTPDGSIPLPRFDGSRWIHSGGKIKIKAIDHLSEVGKQLTGVPLRALNQTASEAVTRILRDYEKNSRGLDFIPAELDGLNVKFSWEGKEEELFGVVYPDQVSDALRLVLNQHQLLAYTDENGVLHFRRKNDNIDVIDCTPRAALTKQNVKTDHKDIFNLVVIEDQNQEVEGQQRRTYEVQSNQLLRYGRFKRIEKKFNKDEVPSPAAAIAKLNESIAESGELTLTSARLLLEVSCGDRVLINPRIGEVADREATVLELQHDFSNGTTDIKVGFLADDMANCPNLGLSYEIIAGEFNQV